MSDLTRVERVLVEALEEKIALMAVHIRDLKRTVKRTETRVVTGFTKMGVDPCSYDGPDEGLSFDSGTNTVYIRGAGTSVTDLLAFTATLDIPASRLRLKLLRASVAQE
jgi:hypothetical protein